jgi:HEPN domain-containing protein
MDKQEELRQWFSIAAQDLALAEHAFKTMHPAPYEQICFHCQQSAEKDLKGFLVLNNIEPPKIHDLPPLLEMCADIESSFSLLTAKCTFVTKYGVMPRYPIELQIYENDVRLALRYAKDIKDFVREKIGGNEDFAVDDGADSSELGEP